MAHNIRLATANDASAILEIYSKYITDTAISFEILVPTLAEFSNRIEDITSTYPYLVYEIDGKIIGYAYASKHKERAAYCYDVEVSVYFSEQYHATGSAFKLYTCLFDILKRQGFYNAYAGYTEPNYKSRDFHIKFDFKPVATFRNVGFKLGKWHDVTWLEKQILPYTNQPNETISIKNLPENYLEDLFNQFS